MLSSCCEGRQEGRKRVSERKEIFSAEPVNEYKDVHDVSAKSLRESVSISDCSLSLFLRHQSI